MPLELNKVIADAKSLLPGNYINPHFDSQAKAIAERAIDDIYHKPNVWRFLIDTRNTITTESGTRSYDFPSSAPIDRFQITDYMAVFVDGEEPMELISLDEMLKTYIPVGSSGTPQRYAIGESVENYPSTFDQDYDVLYFDPCPSSALTIYVYIHKMPTEILSGAGTVASPYVFKLFPYNHRALIVDIILSQLLKDKTEKAAVVASAQNRYAIMERTELYKSSGFKKKITCDEGGQFTMTDYFNTSTGRF